MGNFTSFYENMDFIDSILHPKRRGFSMRMCELLSISREAPAKWRKMDIIPAKYTLIRIARTLSEVLSAKFSVFIRISSDDLANSNIKQIINAQIEHAKKPIDDEKKDDSHLRIFAILKSENRLKKVSEYEYEILPKKKGDTDIFIKNKRKLVIKEPSGFEAYVTGSKSRSKEIYDDVSPIISEGLMEFISSKEWQMLGISGDEEHKLKTLAFKEGYTPTKNDYIDYLFFLRNMISE